MKIEPCELAQSKNAVDLILGPFSVKLMKCTPFTKMTIFRLKQYCKTRGLFCVPVVGNK